MPLHRSRKSFLRMSLRLFRSVRPIAACGIFWLTVNSPRFFGNSAAHGSLGSVEGLNKRVERRKGRTNARRKQKTTPLDESRQKRMVREASLSPIRTTIYLLLILTANYRLDLSTLA